MADFYINEAGDRVRRQSNADGQYDYLDPSNINAAREADYAKRGVVYLGEGMGGLDQMAKALGYPDGRTALEAIQGPGTWGMDGNNNTYTPNSGTVANWPDWLRPSESLGSAATGFFTSPGFLVAAGGYGLGSLAAGALGGAAGAGTYEALGSMESLFGGGELASGLGAAETWGVNPRGGNMSWFDDLFNAGDLGNEATQFTTDPSLADLGGDYGGDFFGGGTYELPDEILNGGSLDTSTLNTLRKLLLGSNSNGKSIVDLLGGTSGLLGAGIQAAPSLAAINYAKNQDPFDTSRLSSLYDSFNPESQAFQYDTNTGLGRTQLTSNLARRGISGSSFGDQSLNNYNTFRDLGRQSLINQGIGTQAGIAGQILNADIAGRQSKNDLYGRALLALSGGLSPRLTGGLIA